MAEVIYEAFKSAGVDDGQAHKAAELILTYDYRLRAIEARLNSMTGQVIDLTEKVDDFSHQLKLLIWLIWIVGFLVGANLAGTLLRGWT